MANSTSQTSPLIAPMLLLLLLLGLSFIANLQTIGAQSIGVCYGMMGNNLPQPWEVISLYRSQNIKRMRLYDPNQDALWALKDSNIEVMLGLPNPDLQNIASNPSTANSWVQTNIRNFSPNVRFRYIVVGNEVNPFEGQFVLPAMRNIHNAIVSAGLQNQIRVSTAIDMTLITNSFPPSNGVFRGDIRFYIDPIVNFLAQIGSPLMANIYPYFSYKGNTRDISLPYALFTAPGVVVWDGSNGYTNLFDALLDALYAALEKSGGGSVEVVVSESGWPTNGDVGATIDNARAHNQNLVHHAKGGTPRRPNRPIETYLFAMFDENNKWPEMEKHFGLFSPSKQQKYSLNFGGERAWAASVFSAENGNGTSVELKSAM